MEDVTAEATHGAEDAPDGSPVEEADAMERRRREAARAARAAAEQGGAVQVEQDALAAAKSRVVQETGTPEDWEEVTDWLLGDEPELVTRKLRVRVGGSDDEPREMPWIIRAIPLDVIRSAEREASAGNRAARRGQQGQARQYDDLKANLRVIVEGTVKPDLREAAQKAGFADPAELVKKKLAFRPGIVAQIAGQIMEISGFSDDDVVAAGNS